MTLNKNELAALGRVELACNERNGDGDPWPSDCLTLCAALRRLASAPSGEAVRLLRLVQGDVIAGSRVEPSTEAAIFSFLDPAVFPPTPTMPAGWIHPGTRICKTEAEIRFDGTDTTGWTPYYAHPPHAAPSAEAPAGAEVSALKRCKELIAAMDAAGKSPDYSQEKYDTEDYLRAQDAYFKASNTAAVAAIAYIRTAALAGREGVDAAGKAWSFLRRVLSQGGDIQLDSVNMGRSYEEQSARLDEAARERVPELLALTASQQAKGA